MTLSDSLGGDGHGATHLEISVPTDLSGALRLFVRFRFRRLSPYRFVAFGDSGEEVELERVEWVGPDTLRADLPSEFDQESLTLAWEPRSDDTFAETFAVVPTGASGAGEGLPPWAAESMAAANIESHLIDSFGAGVAFESLVDGGVKSTAAPEDDSFRNLIVRFRALSGLNGFNLTTDDIRALFHPFDAITKQMQEYQGPPRDDGEKLKSMLVEVGLSDEVAEDFMLGSLFLGDLREYLRQRVIQRASLAGSMHVWEKIGALGLSLEGNRTWLEGLAPNNGQHKDLLDRIQELRKLESAYYDANTGLGLTQRAQVDGVRYQINALLDYIKSDARYADIRDALYAAGHVMLLFFGGHGPDHPFPLVEGHTDDLVASAALEEAFVRFTDATASTPEGSGARVRVGNSMPDSSFYFCFGEMAHLFAFVLPDRLNFGPIVSDWRARWKALARLFTMCAEIYSDVHFPRGRNRDRDFASRNHEEGRVPGRPWTADERHALRIKYATLEESELRMRWNHHIGAALFDESRRGLEYLSTPQEI